MSESLIVPAKDKPTFWNKDAAVGFVLASIPGMIIGGLIGKSRMKDEQISGRVISEPSFWNKSIFVGMLVGGFVGIAVAVGAALALGVASAEAAMAFYAVAVGIQFLGGIIGGFSGKARQEQEYAEAKAYVAQYGNFSPQQARAPHRATEKSYSISPEESAALDARLAEGARSHVDRAMAEPNLAVAR